MKIRSQDELKEYREKLISSYDLKKTTFSICNGPGCHVIGANNLSFLFEEEIKKRALPARILKTGCHGFCERGPIVLVLPQNIFYSKVTSEDIPLIIEETIIKGNIIERLLYEDPITKERVINMEDIPFYKRQTRRLLSLNDKIDPTNIEDYIRYNGYSALAKALSMEKEEVIQEVKRSGLRGLGGAGFPTGRKWEACRVAAGEEKYVVCNADEGDPGAFQDRSVLEGNPHSVLEGMIIAGFAVGAKQGFIYVRAEYPLAVKRLYIATDQARERGFLGRNILGSGFDFDIEIFQGAGAFVCGESTALVLSIEGKRGMPKSLPRPRTTEVGLWDKPTLLNNVKTFANIPLIISYGSEWFASRGTERSKGTAIFSLTGKVANCGLIEVPMGIKLREIVFDIGGGVPGGKAFKAVQTGGPSGGCLPAEFLDIPIDFDSLTAAGSMMGSGGMIVMDETNCMVELARFFMEFIQNESCGKCVPCRIGTKKMLNILTKLTRGKGKNEDIEELERLGRLIKESSLCGLGQTAPNPVLSTIKNFPEDYRVHIEEKFCPLCKSKRVSPVKH